MGTCTRSCGADVSSKAFIKVRKHLECISFEPYNAGKPNECSVLETRISNSSKEYINQSATKKRGQKFLNTPFNECILKETMACDYFVPTIIQDLGHIS